MIKKLLSFVKQPKKGKELLTELDIARVVEVENDAAETHVDEATNDALSDVEEWKQNDLDLLQTTWQTCCAEPLNESAVSAFRQALHNLHGASGAYGGGALTRLSGSLHLLVSDLEEFHDDAALINLHVQACRATSVTNESGAEDGADAVCDALEQQVNARILALTA